MDNGILLDTVIARYRENGLGYSELGVGERHTIFISGRGGHLLGPFDNLSGSSALWITAQLYSSLSFARFLAAGEWNLGGERIWIAPEIQFNIKDRSDFRGTYELPAAMDPGTYRLDSTARQVALSQDIVLDCYNTASGSKHLSVHRKIRASKNPLHSLLKFDQLMDGVVFAGWHHETELSSPVNDGIMAESWNLAQVRPGGEAIIPCTPGIEYMDYYEPIDDSLFSIRKHSVKIQITGDRRYKVGFRAPNLLGRIGYIRQVGDDEAELTVRCFQNDPSSLYIEEPANATGCRGLSLNIYNDDGALGGFGEIECNGRTIGGKTDRSSSIDDVTFWYFRGKTGPITAIATILLG